MPHTPIAETRALEPGAWDFDTILTRKTSRYHGHYDFGFKLYPDASCDYKYGFYAFYSGNSDDMRKDFEKYLGIRTTYRKTKDSLIIANRSSWNGKPSEAMAFKVVAETSRYLTLGDSQGNVYRYKRHFVLRPAGPHYDAIIVTRGSCLGSCPINATMITREGKLFFYGMAFNTLQGFHSGDVDKTVYDSVETQFRRLNVPALKDSYWDYGGSCGATNYVSFIKDRKIVKSIDVYTQNSGPIDFFTAYNGISFLYQRFPMEPLRFDVSPSLWSFDAIGNGKSLRLKESEGFYLAWQLNRSPEVKIPFTPKYRLSYYDNDQSSTQSMETDGRYYKVRNSGKDRVLDLGYDFIKRNDLLRSRK